MNTLTVKTVTSISKSKVRKAMKAMKISADLDLESAEGAQYDYAELTDDNGQVVWSTDGDSNERNTARQFFDKVWS
jgi:hypothetical protein